MFYSTDASINYKRTFKKEDQSLEINVNTSFGNRRSAANNYQTVLPQDSLVYGINNNNSGKENEKEIEIDYTPTIGKKVVFDAGSDITLDDITSTSNVYALQPILNFIYTILLYPTILLIIKKYMLYMLRLSFPVGHLFDAKIGSRYERTEINSFYPMQQHKLKPPVIIHWCHPFIF